MKSIYTGSVLAALMSLPAYADGHENMSNVSTGQRPLFLIDRMEDSDLQAKLAACEAMPKSQTLFSIGHRGASLQFPEHTVEANRAAARQGAGILECDVTFTKDKQLVCRHAQNDLHTTTNILATDLAEQCTTPFSPAEGDQQATAECRTSDITLAEFETLEGKMDAANRSATSVEGYMGGTADYRTDLYAAEGGQLMTHAQSIELFRSLGAKFTPELKDPAVDMPFDGYSMDDYAQALIDEYKAAGVPASDVWAQSFNLDVIKYWIENEPEFGEQAVYLDDRYEASDADEGLVDYLDPDTFEPSMSELKEMGVNYIAPPLWMLLTVENDEIVPSPYAVAAKEAGLEIIAWSFERSGPLNEGGGWYYQSLDGWLNSDGQSYEIVDALAQDVGVAGIFSDWPATITYYANCMGLE